MDIDQARRRAQRLTKDLPVEATLLAGGATVFRPLPRPPRVGDMLAGKYRLISSLGRGGMGRVFLAEHLVLNSTVALKFMHPHLAQDRVSVARFEREARAAATLRSDHAARVLDVGVRESGEPYIVMEHLVGCSLDRVAQQGRGLPVAEAVIHTIQACHALAEAHARGIIHRDVKPANLFLTTGKSGESIVKVLDFGLAKSEAGVEPAHAGELRALGTPQYMAPEQIRGADVDARTDVWSLGATLYELLTARAAFDAPNATLVFARILQGSPVPVRAARSDVSEELAAVIDRCLRRDPAERYGSMRELKAALAQLEQLGHGVPRPSFPSRTARSMRPSGEHSGGAMVISAELPAVVNAATAGNVRNAVLKALLGPGAVAVGAAAMAVWMALAPEAAPATRQARTVASAGPRSAGSTRHKDTNVASPVPKVRLRRRPAA